MSGSPVWKTSARALAAFFYGAGARLHRRIARATAPSRGRPACAVVSVGGLTVGGSGKTPLAACLAKGLRERGFRVALASRGYKGSSRAPVQMVSDGSRIHSSVACSGDESLVLAAHAPGVPVLVGRDRRIVAHHAVALFDAEIIVLDDGFQHHRLARDLDIVCVDGTAGVGNGHVLPWGPLREPLSSLRYADWLCVVDAVGSLPESLPQSLAESRALADFVASGGKLLRAHRRPSALRAIDQSSREPLEALAGREVGLIAGVARPGSVRRTLESLGARVVAERLFADHHVYRSVDLAGLGEGPDSWVTTEKDALKILPRWLGETRLWVLGIELEIDRADEVLDDLETHLVDRRVLAAGSSRSRDGLSRKTSA